jgi:3-oxoacyl-[acyl-carrier-protein] synthase III
MPFQILSVKSQFPKKFEKLNSLNLKKRDKKKLYQTTGINKRYISSNNEDVISLSIKSAQKIITDQIKNQIGFLFFVSQTSPYKFPSASCILQDKLGLSKDIFAIDINMGCSGYIYALKLANSLNCSKKKYGLIICSDTYTKFIDNSNNSCKPIFSDASTTTLLKKTKQNFLKSFEFGVDGSCFKDLILHNNSKNMFMNGAKIAIFTLKIIPTFIKNFLKKNNIKENKIKFVLLHQASKYVCEKIKKKLNLKNSIFLTNFNKYGNTVSSTIPLLLEKAISGKKIKKNDTLIACGFGVGLSWGVVEIKW